MQHVHSATRARGLDTPRVINLIITGTQDIIEENEMCSPLGKSDHVVLKINSEKLTHMCRKTIQAN